MTRTLFFLPRQFSAPIFGDNRKGQKKKAAGRRSACLAGGRPTREPFARWVGVAKVGRRTCASAFVRAGAAGRCERARGRASGACARSVPVGYPGCSREDALERSRSRPGALCCANGRRIRHAAERSGRAVMLQLPAGGSPNGPITGAAGVRVERGGGLRRGATGEGTCARKCRRYR